MTARNFSLIIGIVYLAAGVLGFVPALLSPAPDSAPPVGITGFYGYLLGLFPVNFMHNLVHLAIGAWGIAASRSVGGARAYSKVLAVFYGVLAVMGLVPAMNTMFGLVPIHGHDVWLHAGTAILAAYFGWIWKATGATQTRTAH
ncbi:MAG TPA: DUF4383 domain-containing protein [Burkholderiales bacterium]|nr:DUF4383 domain-containing protein [Burkholderiales bacterium]